MSVVGAGSTAGTGGASSTPPYHPPTNPPSFPDAGPCPEGVEPTIVVTNLEQPTDIALTATHVYWAGSTAIMRQPKAGGKPETVIEIESGVRAPFIDSGRLYWWGWQKIYGMSIDGQLPPETLVTQATIAMGWVVIGGTIWFVNSRATSNEYDLMSAPAGEPGPTKVVVSGIMTIGPIAADWTGVYWYNLDGHRARGDPAFIKKYTFATGEVTNFAVVQDYPLLHADGNHVVWADASDAGGVVGSNTPDGLRPMLLGGARLIQQLAMDASAAFWAVGDLYDSTNSDIVTAPFDGGSARKIACHMPLWINCCEEFLRDGLEVDETSVYFTTYIDGVRGIGKIPKQPR
jgi:hypothetical protein